MAAKMRDRLIGHPWIHYYTGSQYVAYCFGVSDCSFLRENPYLLTYFHTSCGGKS